MLRTADPPAASSNLIRYLGESLARERALYSPPAAMLRPAETKFALDISQPALKHGVRTVSAPQEHGNVHRT